MPLRYVSRKAEEKVEEVATKLGYEPLPPPGPVEDLLPEDLLPEDTVTVRSMTDFMETLEKRMGEGEKRMLAVMATLRGKGYLDDPTE